ncbi:MAG TPA: type II secretion system protein [Dehalococcoidia bacterium]|nr:type II secretion system protein [Dehalococcoidia bacterium]
MKDFLKKMFPRVAGGQGGFTLIEMIVVVGIIAVLAAVIVPNIGKFIGTGESGAQDAEQGSVETAIAAMMAEQPVSALTANTNSTQLWSALPENSLSTPVPLWSTDAADRYLQDQTTNWFYCYDAQGTIINNSGDANRLVSDTC